jgi:hypothetical protein
MSRPSNWLQLTPDAQREWEHQERATHEAEYQQNEAVRRADIAVHRCQAMLAEHRLEMQNLHDQNEQLINELKEATAEITRLRRFLDMHGRLPDYNEWVHSALAEEAEQEMDAEASYED